MILWKYHRSDGNLEDLVLRVSVQNQNNWATISKSRIIKWYTFQISFTHFWARHKQKWEGWEREHRDEWGMNVSSGRLYSKEIKKCDKSFLAQNRKIWVLTSTLWVLNKETVHSPFGEQKRNVLNRLKIWHKQMLRNNKMHSCFRG